MNILKLLVAVNLLVFIILLLRLMYGQDGSTDHRTLSANLRFNKKSNIVLFLVDDLDLVLSSWTGLPKTRDLLGKQGIIFDNAFATTPVCCPNRASILTGQYLHNHLTVNNSLSGNCSSRDYQQLVEPFSFARYVSEQEYTTFYAGKYLNQYGDEVVGGVKHVPPGWDWWIGLVGNSKYYNYSLSVNGSREIHGDDPDSDYLTDVLHRYAISFLDQWNPSDKPILMVVAPPACHAPFTPHPKYADNFTDLSAPRTPSYGLGAQKDKHWLVRETPEKLTKPLQEQIDEIFRNRLRTLLSVDAMVADVLQKLKNKGELEETYIIFTSDHGYHLGQFAEPWDKRQPYETDIRVPFVISGPGIEAGLTKQDVVLTLDLAPTIIELAGGEVPSDMDGTSLVPLLSARGAKHWRSMFLVEYRGEGYPGPVPGCPQYTSGGVANCNSDCICQDASNNTYNCLRKIRHTQNYIYCAFKDNQNFEEYYDLNTDPWELHNTAENEVDLTSYRELLNERLGCSGVLCE